MMVALQTSTVASVLSTVLTTVDAVGHDRGRADHCGGPGNRRADDASACHSCGS